MIRIFIFLLFSLSLSADIKYKGDCMGYQIDVDIKHNDYKDLYCYPNQMLSWNATKKLYYRVVPISGDVYTGLSMQEMDSSGRYKEKVWINIAKENIKSIGSPTKIFLDGLSGILVGFGFFQIIMLIGG